jgi:phenol 2-monooxygenase
VRHPGSHDGGSILLIPREGGHLFRMYVDLGEVAGERHHAVRNTTIEQIIHKANEILHPYTLDVRNVAWHSVYEVGHRLTDRFDDVLPAERVRAPRGCSSPATPATRTVQRQARA